MQILNAELNVKQDKVYFLCCTFKIKGKKHRLHTTLHGYDFAKELEPINKLIEVLASSYNLTSNDLKELEILNWNLL